MNHCRPRSPFNQDQIGVGGALGVGDNRWIIWSVFFPDHHHQPNHHHHQQRSHSLSVVVQSDNCRYCEHCDTAACGRCQWISVFLRPGTKLLRNHTHHRLSDGLSGELPQNNPRPYPSTRLLWVTGSSAKTIGGPTGLVVYLALLNNPGLTTSMQGYVVLGQRHLGPPVAVTSSKPYCRRHLSSPSSISVLGPIVRLGHHVAPVCRRNSDHNRNRASWLLFAPSDSSNQIVITTAIP